MENQEVEFEDAEYSEEEAEDQEVDQGEEEDSSDQEVDDRSTTKEPAPEPQEEEKEKYSEKVQKRINKATRQRREAEERAAFLEEQVRKLEAERNQDRQQMAAGQAAALQTTSQSYETAEKALKMQLEDAINTKDGALQAELMTQLQNVNLQRQAAEWQRQQYEQVQRQQQQYTQQQAAQYQQPQYAQQQYQQPQYQQQPVIRQAAQTWVSKNSWFQDPSNKDAVGVAVTLEKTLEDEGLDPNDDSFYNELDRRMSVVRPDLYPAPPQQQTTRPVSPVSPPNRGKGDVPKGRGKKITEEDKQIMRMVNLDPSNPAHRQAYLQRNQI